MESYNIEKMKVPQLRERLLELGLESKGLKHELIARINAHYDNLRTIRLSKNKYKQSFLGDSSVFGINPVNQKMSLKVHKKQLHHK